MDDREQRIREKAFQLWLEEGQPEGQQDRHWELASELVAIEDSQMDATIPVAEAKAGEPVEPIEALENTGEYPTTTDQGEMEIPHHPGDRTSEIDAAGDNEPVSEIETIRRTLEVPKQRRGAGSPQGDPQGAMAGTRASSGDDAPTVGPGRP
jgi:hypothetical protein